MAGIHVLPDHSAPVNKPYNFLKMDVKKNPEIKDLVSSNWTNEI